MNRKWNTRGFASIKPFNAIAFLFVRCAHSYTLTLNNTYKSVLLMQPILASMAIALTLFCIVMNDWYSGYGYIIFTYAQMFILCALGQSIQTNVSH